MYSQLKVILKTPCSMCGENFEKMNCNQKYCDVCRLIRDHAHKKRSQIKIALRKKIQSKVCQQCYSLFNINHGDRNYCNIKCQRRSNKIKHLEKRIKEIQQQIILLVGTKA